MLFSVSVMRLCYELQMLIESKLIRQRSDSRIKNDIMFDKKILCENKSK